MAMMGGVANRQRRLANAVWLIRRDVQDAGRDIRSARLAAGLTLDAVAAAIGCSSSTVMRTEQGIAPGPRPELLARHAATVGLRARIKLYPEGPPIRDAGQIALARALCRRIHPDVPVDMEPPVIITPNSGDRRAFDLLLTHGACRCGVELYTRFHDCQAQLRSAQLKQRDSGVERLLIVVQATHANRRALAAAADLIPTTFPLGTRQVLAALGRGRDPGANGLVLL